MIINIRELLNKGKTEQEFFFEYQADNRLVDLPDTLIVNPVRVLGSLKVLSKDSAFVDAEVIFRLKGACSRCLAETEKEFRAELKQRFAPDSDECYPVVKDAVNLDKAVDDEIVLNLPLNLLCDTNCKGLCAVCGKNLNDGDCGCQK